MEGLNEQVIQDIKDVMRTLFPYGAGKINDYRAQWALEKIGRLAFAAGRDYALLGLMTANDVAERLDVTPARARVLLQNRHRRFGVGFKAGNMWLVHVDELPMLEPDKRYPRPSTKS